MARPVRGLSVAACTLLVALPLAAAQPPASLATSAPSFFLLADGSLAPEPAEPAGAPCVLLQPGDAGRAEATFSARLRQGPYAVLAERIPLDLALAGSGGPSQAGSGFEVQATLRFGDGPAYHATQRFEAASAPPAARVEFAVVERHADVAGPVTLVVALVAVPGGLPAPIGQDVRVLCNHQGSRLGAFDYAAGGLAATDADGDGIPDAEGAPAATAGGRDGRAGLPDVMGFSLLASVATFGGGLVVLAGRQVSERRLHFLLGVTAGLLLAIAIADLVPEAVALSPSAPWTVALGVAGLYGLRWLWGGHGHGHGESKAGDRADHVHDHGGGAHVTRLAWVTFGALALHTFIDGVVLPAALELDAATAWTVLGAIMAHVFPDGMAGATVFLAAAWPRRRAFQGVSAIALFVPLGALAGLALLVLPGVVAHLVALAAATFIFIALSELVPELQQSQHRAVVGVGFLAGYGLAFTVELLARSLGG